MQIEGSVALVTGANRGIGREWVRQLQERGARRVYASARDAETITAAGAEALTLDITDPLAVTRVAALATDVTFLVNNAGIATHSPLITGDLDAARREMETHFWGTAAMIRAFAPILAANGGGAILNMLSVLSWRTFATDTAYGAAKAAAWSLTDGARLELAEQRTQVTGLFVGAVDTEMMAGYDGPMQRPAAVVSAGLDGIAAGVDEVLADTYAQDAKDSLGRAPRERYPELVWSPG